MKSIKCRDREFPRNSSAAEDPVVPLLGGHDDVWRRADHAPDQSGTPSTEASENDDPLRRCWDPWKGREPLSLGGSRRRAVRRLPLGCWVVQDAAIKRRCCSATRSSEKSGMRGRSCHLAHHPASFGRQSENLLKPRQLGPPRLPVEEEARDISPPPYPRRHSLARPLGSRPWLIASSSAFDMPSRTDVERYTSASLRYGLTSATAPGKAMRSSWARLRLSAVAREGRARHPESSDGRAHPPAARRKPGSVWSTAFSGSRRPIERK